MLDQEVGQTVDGATNSWARDLGLTAVQLATDLGVEGWRERVRH